MLDLNIIPDELKKENRLDSIHRSLRNLMLTFFIFLLFYTAALWGSKVVLQKHYTETIEETTLLTQNTENYSKQVGLINSQINSIETIQDSTIKWSYLLEYFSINMPTGITVKNFQVSQATQAITIGGVAETRDSLLALKTFLEDTAVFTEVNLPIKTMLEKENIDFTIQLKYLVYDFDKQ